MVRRVLLFTLCVCAIGGCVRSQFNLATQQEELTMTSTAKEVEMGRAIARHVEEDMKLSLDEPLQARVRAIGERLASVCDRKELNYRFAVIEDPEVNAFSLPGGYVFINEGLIKKTSNDDELAGVIAHEIAHVAARHAIKRYETSLGLQILQLATLAARQGQVAGGVGVAAQAAQLAYARDDELEADKLGVRYLKAAGFDPNGMLSFLGTLEKVDADKNRYMPRGVVRPQYALTHPFVSERVRAVKEALFGVADYIDYLNTPN